MPELYLLLAGLFVISVNVLLGIAIIAPLFLIVCFTGLIVRLWLGPSALRYSTRGVVVDRAYSQERWDQVYMPGPPMMMFPQRVQARPHLLIEVEEGKRAWLACNRGAYDRWPHYAVVRVEYELDKDGAIIIVDAWLDQR